MHFNTIAAATIAWAALTMAAPIEQRQAAGTTTIINNCAFDIQMDTCAPNVDQGTITIASGSTWSAQQQGVGISHKLFKDSIDNIAQVEYSNVGGTLWYDLSLINGNPFSQFPQSLRSSSQDALAAKVVCAAGSTSCQAAYMYPTQDRERAPGANPMRNAPTGTNLIYSVC